MNKRLFTSLLMCICCLYVNAKGKYHFDIDFHKFYGYEMSAKYMRFDRDDFDLTGMALHFTLRRDIIDRLSVGLGLGIDVYEDPHFGTLPLFATVHFSPIKKHTPFYLFSNIGYSREVPEKIRGGSLFDIGMGYKLKLGRRFGLNFQLNYNYKTFSNSVFCTDEYTGETSVYASNRRSIAAGIGITF